MRLARVAGNVVSTVKDRDYAGQKLLIVDFLDEAGRPTLCLARTAARLWGCAPGWQSRCTATE